MKLIIAGGRKYVFTRGDAKRIDAINPSEIVSGGATGADAGGEKYAKVKDIPLKLFPADWSIGNKAGPIRNTEMAKYADAVALFKGGYGTADMYKKAVANGLTIYDFR